MAGHLSTHIRSIEGARGVAAMSVLTYHVGVFADGRPTDYITSAPPLWLGVQLFFMLSGLLLFRPFAHAIIARSKWPSLRRYARSRLLRIVPAYWLVLTFLVIEKGRTDPLPLAANYLLVHVPLGVPSVVGGAWTLSMEISFYAFLPVFAFAVKSVAWRAPDRASRALVIVLALLPAFPLSYAYMRNAGINTGWPMALPAYLDEFAVGMLLAVFLEVVPRVSPRTSRLLLVAALGVGFGASRLYSFGTVTPYGNGSGSIYATLMVVSFALVLGSVLTRGERTLLGRVLASRLLVAAGTISYGIYLWNLVVIRQLAPTQLWVNEWVGWLLATTLVVTIASASWLTVERRMLALKNTPFWRTQRQMVEIPAPWPAVAPPLEPPSVAANSG
jgi:peptidoglycan/LPS O-acetylase OafA/YrhL